MGESALLAAARRGDLEAFNRLVLAYQTPVYNAAYRILGDPAAAADVTQETFIAAYKNLRRYRGGSFRAWLMRIATNRCYDVFRRQARRPTTSLDSLGLADEEEQGEAPEWLAAEGDTPEEAVERGDLIRAIERCLERLPPEFRMVAVLVDVQGYDYREAAQALDAPLGTVKSRLARARAALRECLQGVRELLPERYRLEDEADG